MTIVVYDPYPWLTQQHSKVAGTLGSTTIDPQIDAWLHKHSQNPRTSTYTNEVDRLAYCIAHFPIAVTVVQTLLSHPRKWPLPWSATLFGRGLDVVSLGCGPGSDLIGALRALGALPLALRLHGADVEPGWKDWISGAIADYRGNEPRLAGLIPDPEFTVLDLSDPQATRDYLTGIASTATMKIYTIHRLLGTVRAYDAFVNVLVDTIEQESLVVAVTPPKDIERLQTLAKALDAKRAGKSALRTSDRLEHHGFNVPGAFWSGLKHRPEIAADYASLVYLTDVAS